MAAHAEDKSSHASSSSEKHSEKHPFVVHDAELTRLKQELRRMSGIQPSRATVMAENLQAAGTKLHDELTDLIAHTPLPKTRILAESVIQIPTEIGIFIKEIVRQKYAKN